MYKFNISAVFDYEDLLRKYDQNQKQVNIHDYKWDQFYSAGNIVVSALTTKRSWHNNTCKNEYIL